MQTNQFRLHYLNSDASNLKPNVVTTKLKTEVPIKSKDKSLSIAIATVSMDPYYHVEALMKFTTKVSYKELSSKAEYSH